MVLTSVFKKTTYPSIAQTVAEYGLAIPTGMTDIVVDGLNLCQVLICLKFLNLKAKSPKQFVKFLQLFYQQLVLPQLVSVQ